MNSKLVFSAATCNFCTACIMKLPLMPTWFSSLGAPFFRLGKRIRWIIDRAQPLDVLKRMPNIARNLRTIASFSIQGEMHERLNSLFPKSSGLLIWHTCYNKITADAAISGCGGPKAPLFRKARTQWLFRYLYPSQSFQMVHANSAPPHEWQKQQIHLWKLRLLYSGSSDGAASVI